MPDNILGFLNKNLPWIALNGFETTLTIAIINAGGKELPLNFILPIIVYCFISYFLTYFQWNLVMRMDNNEKLPAEKIYPIWIVRGILILILSFYLLSFIFCFHC